MSYNQKHNDANFENNRDGTNDNASWNCGHEGATNNEVINQLRLRQKKNMIFALCVSLGVPMIYMGDEYKRTKGGNNNTWCHDSKLNWFDWSKLQNNDEMYLFLQKCLEFRKNNELICKEEFLQESDVYWHSQKAFEPNWENESQVLAYTLLDHSFGNDLYIAFNTSSDTVEIELPTQKNRHWQLLMDTTFSSKKCFSKNSKIVQTTHYNLLPHTSCLMRSTII